MARPTLLCVDDDSASRTLYRHLLGCHGYDVVVAEDGVQALDTLNRSSVSAVLLDYEMPGLNGSTVAMHLRGIDKEVPIILHTGGAAPCAEELALFNSFVSKGARLSAMLAAIEGALLQRASK